MGERRGVAPMVEQGVMNESERVEALGSSGHCWLGQNSIVGGRFVKSRLRGPGLEEFDMNHFDVISDQEPVRGRGLVMHPKW